MINKGVINININIKVNTSNLDELTNVLSSAIKREKKNVIIEDSESESESESVKSLEGPIKKTKKSVIIEDSDSESEDDIEIRNDRYFKNKVNRLLCY